MNIRKRISEGLSKLEQQHLSRERKLLQSAQGSTVEINGRTCINFSNNDYLGLANSESLKFTMQDAIGRYGVGACSSQLICGFNEIHKQTERKLADFLNRDDAIIFTNGYLANLSAASVLIDKNTVVLQDKLNHASLIDAALLSRGKLIRYKHCDMVHLKALLEKHKKQNCIVMSDGVFSMDGDYAKVEELSSLCADYNALLYIDDAHGIGVLGETGGGLLQSLGLGQNQVPLVCGTFGKAFGCAGSFIAGEEIFVRAIIQNARTYIYTTALMPAIAATINKAIDIVSDASHLRKQLFDNVALFRCGINDKSKLSSKSHIQPLCVGAASDALTLSQHLFEDDIYATAIRPPTVPVGQSRIRISMNASHTKHHIKKLLKSINSYTE